MRRAGRNIPVKNRPEDRGGAGNHAGVAGETPRVNRLVHLACIVVISVLVFAAYSNAVQSGFVWDDEFLIRDNTAIRSLANAASVFKTYLAATSGNINNFYRPVQELSYMADYFLWGYVPAGFHFTNICLHALCAILVYLFAFRVLKNVAAAFVTAALFGIHPLNTEAVSYVAGRADPLYLIFFLASFILFLRSAALIDSDRIRYGALALALVCYLLSILSKEIGLILPLMLLLYVFAFYGSGAAGRKLYLLCLPFVLIAAAYGIARRTVLDFSGIAPGSWMVKVDLPHRLLTSCKAVCVYLQLLILPFGLHMERTIRVVRSAWEPSAIGALLAVVLAVAAIWRCRTYNRKLFFAGMWFFIGLLPVSNIVPINSFIAEHWLYMPAIGAFMAAGMGVAAVIGRPGRPYFNFRNAAVVSALALVLAFYGYLAFERNKDWKDGISFFKSALKYSPRNAKLHLNFGNAYYCEGDRKNAMKEYEKTLELRPNYAEAYANIGSLYLEEGNYARAREYVEKALSIKPDFPNARNMKRVLDSR